MTDLIITKVTKASVVDARQFVYFKDGSGMIIPATAINYFGGKVIKIEAGMIAQAIRDDGRLLSVIISSSLVEGKIIPTVPFAEVNFRNLSWNGIHTRGDIDILDWWYSWTRRHNVKKIIDGRKDYPFAVEVDEHGGII